MGVGVKMRYFDKKKSADATVPEGGCRVCRYFGVVSLCVMQKMGKMFGGFEKCPYLCSVKIKKTLDETTKLANNV